MTRILVPIVWLLIGLTLLGWLGGYIVAVSDAELSFSAAFLEESPWRGSLASGALFFLWAYPMMKSCRRQYWWIWGALLSLPVLLACVQVYFLLWPHEWHGRTESWKTVAIFIKTFWMSMVPYTLFAVIVLIAGLRWFIEPEEKRSVKQAVDIPH